MAARCGYFRNATLSYFFSPKLVLVPRDVSSSHEIYYFGKRVTILWDGAW
jgi:hypothetical protein